ncbi:glycosyl hydrolase family 28-related protein [Acetobacter sp. AC2005]|uniref:glycosyl hydrolase family 28-related protein n=1 Tax=Acetobacter sp. AC2005 TaxID=3134142 RepID=UPI0030D21CBB
MKHILAMTSLLMYLSTPTAWSQTIQTDISNMKALAAEATTPREISEKFNDVISVKDFGAKGDGMHDDTAAIQAAIGHALATPNYGGRVYFPDGVYLISSALNVAGSGIALIGANANSTILQATFTTGTFINIGSSSSTHNSNIRISNLAFSANHPLITGEAILAQDVNNLNIDHIIMKNNIYDGIRIENPNRGTYGVFISHFWFDSILHDGFVFGKNSKQINPPTDIYLSYGGIQPGQLTAGDAIHAYSFGGLYLTNVDITNKGSNFFTKGLNIEPKHNQVANALICSMCLFDSSRNDNLHIGGEGKVADIQFVNSWASTSIDGDNIVIESGDGILIGSSTIDSAAKNGLVIMGGRNIQINANKILGNGCSSSKKFSGIVINSNISDFTITNNQIGSGGYFATIGSTIKLKHAISLAPGASNGYVIIGNRGTGISDEFIEGDVTGSSRYVAGNIKH